MKVTPLDIRRREFKRSMRGYSDEEVDIFLDEVADEFERLFQENIELQDRLQRMEEQISGHAQIREALEKTLISAQLQADEIRTNARKEGELILRDAELKARHIVNDSYGETQRVQQALVQLKHLEEDFRFKFRSLLEGHLKLLSESQISVPGVDDPAREGEQAAEAAASAEKSAPDLDVWLPAQPESAAGDSGEPDSVSGGERRGADPGWVGPDRVAPSAGGAGGESTPDDDTPTEETAAADEMGAAAARRSDEGGLDASQLLAELTGFAAEVAEVAPEPSTADVEWPAADSQGAMRGSEEPDGFFFGRRLDEDYVFPPPEPEKRDTGRDFEW